MNDSKINDVFYGRIVIPFHTLSINGRNSKVFTHFDFKMALSFATINSIAGPERKKTKTLFLNVKKLLNLHLVWNTIGKLHWGDFIFHYTINSSASLKPKFTQICQYYCQVLFRHCTYNNFLR